MTFYADLAQVFVRTHLSSVVGRSNNKVMKKSEFKPKKLVEGH